MKLLHASALLLLPLAALAQKSGTARVLRSPDVAPPLTHPAPVYPPIAKAAHVVGDVVLEVDVLPNGHTRKVTAISGPAMLRAASVDAVKQWTWQPWMLNGKATPFSTTATVTFMSDADLKDEEIARKYFPSDQACIEAVQRNVAPSDQARTCTEAAETAESFAPGTRFIERRSAFVYTTTATLRDGSFKDALSWGNKAVAVIQEGHDDNSGSAAAYGVRAQAEVANRDLLAADKDLVVAEDFQRKGVEWVKTASDAGMLLPSYVRTLKGLLNLHVMVLTALHRDTEAKAKSDEAARL